MMAKQNILITGGAGFIGSNLARYYLAKGDCVWVVDNLQTGSLENVEPFKQDSKFCFDQADMQKWAKLEEAVGWADKIFHAAASVGQKIVLSDPIGTLTNNNSSCERLYEAMVKTKSDSRVLILSTSEVYAFSKTDSESAFRENADLQFPSGKFLQENYRLSKLMNEALALSCLYQKNIDSVVVRLFNTIGVNQSPFYGMVVPNFIRQALANKPLTVFGDGQQTRSFCNVADVVTALDLLMENPESKGEIVNVGNDKEISILNLAHVVKKITQSSSDIMFVPYKKAYGVDFQDVRRRKPCLDKLRQLTGFYPVKSLEETIQELISLEKISASQAK